MNQEVTLGGWSGRQLETMKRTFAPDANENEFHTFLNYAIAQKLDPFRGHIILSIYSKDDPKKRKANILVTQAGARVIASRCGDYMPAEVPTEYITDESLKGPNNPAGLVLARVRLKKLNKIGEYRDVIGETYWNERVPLRPNDDCYEWVDTGETWPDSGKPKKRRQLRKGTDVGAALTLDPTSTYFKMPRTMLEKCATMAALRAGWPEYFDDLHSEDEMEQARAADITATEMIAMEQEARRAKAVGMGNDEYPFVDDQGNLHFVAAGVYGQKLLAEAHDYREAEALRAMIARNREGFNRYWAKHKADALEVKAELEKVEAKLIKQKEQATA